MLRPRQLHHSCQNHERRLWLELLNSRKGYLTLHLYPPSVWNSHPQPKQEVSHETRSGNSGLSGVSQDEFGKKIRLSPTAGRSQSFMVTLARNHSFSTVAALTTAALPCGGAKNNHRQSRGCLTTLLLCNVPTQVSLQTRGFNYERPIGVHAPGALSSACSAPLRIGKSVGTGHGLPVCLLR